MAQKLTVSVDGLKQFSSALRKLDSDSPKAVKGALNSCADFVIGKVTPLIPVRTGRARRSLKARSTRGSVRIAVGGRTAPYYPWLDFGGRTGKFKSNVRKFYKEGRYLYPTLRRNRQEFIDFMQDALVDVAKGAGLDVD